MTPLALALAALTLVTPARAEAVAADVEAVVAEAPEALGDPATTRILLATVVVAESGLRVAVERCHARGDGGRSIGLTQIIAGPNRAGIAAWAICADRRQQLRLGLAVLTRCWARVPRRDAALRCYASGDPGLDSDTARRAGGVLVALGARL